MECERCGTTFTRKDNLRRHQVAAKNCRAKKQKIDETVEPKTYNFVRCNFCETLIEKRLYHAHLRSNVHKSNAFVILDDGVERTAGAFGEKIIAYRISDPQQFTAIDEFTYRIREKVLNLITSCVSLHHNVKVNLECFAMYFLNNEDNGEIKSFNTKNKVISRATDLYETYSEFTTEMDTKMSEFQERDSGWTLVRILYMELNCSKFNPTRGSSYMDLPRSIYSKRAVINVQNSDEACFAWAITSALHPPNGLPQRTSSYPHYTDIGLDFTGLEFPVKLNEIHRFEKNNFISINVYGINSYFNGDQIIDEIITLHICKQKFERHINLLLVSDSEGSSHYCWIKNLSRLVSSQASLHGHEQYICDGCLVFFSCEFKLARHQSEDCNKVRTTLPTTNVKINKYGRLVTENILQFDNFQKQLKVPFVVYADFEALLKPIEPDKDDKRVENKPFTVKCFEHVPYSFAYFIKCSYDDSLSKFHLYRGHNAAVEFMRQLEKDAINIYNNYLSVNKGMVKLSIEEEHAHQLSTHCHICEKPFDHSIDKVYDHDHLTGSYRGAAHSICNLHYQLPNFIPVLFHNLSNYDCHMFVKDIASNEEQVDVIAQNKEKYISFSKKIHVDNTVDANGKPRKVYLKVRFIDSFRFMSCSLERLGAYLTDDQCVEIKNKFSDPIRFRLIRQKGVFPYSFLDCFAKLDITSLPARADFYDLLTDENVSEEDYVRATAVWNAFKCNTLGEYSDMYLTSDVLLLADVFENFRNISMENYMLDPCQYFTAPGFGWDALLRMTGVQLELLTDIDMLHFFKKGIRGGLSMCSRRAAVANNTFITDYDASMPSSYILYLDATNLYGHAMRRKLPTGKFRWLSDEEIRTFDVFAVCEESDIGYVLEVDLEYPSDLHDLHNDFPFCPENKKPPGSKGSKLIVDLEHKTKYIIHSVNLKQCLTHGLRLMRVHRILEFQQSNWMRPYIDFNSFKRENACDDFERNHYKSMNNIVFGKTMENVENRVDVRLLTHWSSKHKKPGVEALIAQPNFKSCKIFSDNLVAIEMGIVEIYYNKPLYVGFTVLDLSKTVIYHFFYDFIKQKYGDAASLLYTDTDSLILLLHTANVYEDIRLNSEWFDTSNYKENNCHHIPRGRQVVGKMKDEYPDTIVTSFYGTGAKAYCVTLLDDVVKKAKGVKRAVIRKNLSVADYKRIVDRGGSIYKQMYVFRSNLHTIYTELKNKVALSAKDDKRYVLQDGHRTLAWGHKDIPHVEDDTALDRLLDLLYENLP